MDRPLLVMAAILGAHAVAGCAGAPPTPALPPPVTSDRDTIRAFSDQAELARFVEQLSDEGRREYDRLRANDPPPPFYPDVIYHPPLPPPRPAGVPFQSGGVTPSGGSGDTEPSPPPRPSAAATGAPAASAATASGGTAPPQPVPAPAPRPVLAAPTQTGGEPRAGGPEAAPGVGVDEGGVVKAMGDYLVVLHRGRLFSVRVGGGSLQPVSAVDAFGPGVPAESRTYGRMLVSGERVMVLGTQELSGSDSNIQVGVFRLAPDGRLAHEATYGLRSVDPYRRYFYSSRTDAVRLVGDRLVFYVPLEVERDDPLAGFPLVRGPGVASSAAAATRVYRPAGRVTSQRLHLHALTTCDLAQGAPRCESTALLAGGDRPFHVSPTAVYLWATQPESWARDAPERSVLYRVPLDGSAPTAVHVDGRPVDEQAFLERDGHLHVLLGMDASAAAPPGVAYGGRPALLRLPLSAFGSGRDTAAAEHYRALPGTVGPRHYRFMGDWLVYAIVDSPVGASSTVHAVRLAGGGESRVVLPYRLDRIAAMDAGVAVAGASHGGDLYVDVLRLGPAGVSQADRRNLGPRHARPGLYSRLDGDGAGVLGLPLYGPHRPGYEHLGLGSASLLLLRAGDYGLSEMGELASGEPTGNDACVTSCGAWYGNARALFPEGRILALLGFDLVEGREEGGRVRELRRVSLAPTAPTAAVAGAWEFTETIGAPVGRYRCANRGTMRLDPAAGGSLRVLYRQTGECTVDGATSPSDGEGSGTGTLGPDGMTLDVNGCRYQAVMLNPDELRAFISCRIPMPSGPALDVTGQLEARRARS